MPNSWRSSRRTDGFSAGRKDISDWFNAAAADLCLLASATNAIDKGLTLSTVTNDMDGDRRPRGASSEIGADEFTTNAPPRMTEVRLISTNVVVAFTTFLGESYDALRADMLSGGTWLLLAAGFPGTGGAIRITDTNAAGQRKRFYRARISP